MASITSSFTGTDGSDISTLGFTDGTNLEINANHAIASSSTGYNFYRAGAASTVDQDIQSTFVVGHSSHGTPWIGGRTASGGDGYFCRYDGGSWYLYVRSGGTSSQLGSYTGDVPTAAKTGKLEIRDATKKVYVDTVERISSTNNAVTAAGSFGLGTWYGNASTAVYIDDYAAQDASGSPDITIGLTGQAATTARGSLATATEVALTGRAVTGTAGSVGYAPSSALTGVAATTAQGVVSKSVAIALSGMVVTASQGASQVGVAKELTGVAVAATQGSVTYSADAALTIALTGVGVTIAQGTLGVSQSLPLQGQVATVAQGTVTYSESGALTIALSGHAITASQQPLSTLISLAATGFAVTAAQGPIAPSVSFSLQGVGTSSLQGSPAFASALALTGNEIVATPGSLGYEGAVSALTVALTGFQIEAAQGTLGYDSGELPEVQYSGGWEEPRRDRTDRDADRRRLGILSPEPVVTQVPITPAQVKELTQVDRAAASRAARSILERFAPKATQFVEAIGLPTPDAEPTMAPVELAPEIQATLIAAQRQRMFEQDLVYIVATVLS